MVFILKLIIKIIQWLFFIIWIATFIISLSLLTLLALFVVSKLLNVDMSMLIGSCQKIELRSIHNCFFIATKYVFKNYPFSCLSAIIYAIGGLRFMQVARRIKE